MRTVSLVILWLLTAVAHADIILSARDPRVAPGTPAQLDLTITNDGREVLAVEIPSPLHVRLETAEAVTTLEFTPRRSGMIEVAPQGFVRIALDGIVPGAIEGAVTLVAMGLETNRLALQIDRGGSATSSIAANALMAEAGPAPAGKALLFDKPPPLAVSVYEPVYFLIGGDGGLNAKFQVSFRYRLFDDRGRWARRLPWIDDLYLSYSQTSLWDLGELSKPFRDSSYRPRLFFANYDMARFLDGQLRLGVETGFGHESNGKEGEDSRSYNMLYLRPALTYGDPEGLRAYAAPLIHNYLKHDENPDLADYRGYVDWLFGIGSKGGLDFWAVLRKGGRSDFGSIEWNLSYPLSRLSGGDLTGWLMLQYFGGYGESLLDYRRKLDAQFRLGIAVAL